jgi:hypothetical protein
VLLRIHTNPDVEGVEQSGRPDRDVQVAELKGVEGTRVEPNLHDGTQSSREGLLNSIS